jgi:hypothetical protein
MDCERKFMNGWNMSNSIVKIQGTGLLNQICKLVAEVKLFLSNDPKMIRASWLAQNVKYQKQDQKQKLSLLCK